MGVRLVLRWIGWVGMALNGDCESVFELGDSISIEIGSKGIIL